MSSPKLLPLLFLAALTPTTHLCAETYLYDELGRLKSSTQSGLTTTYVYDENGNIRGTATSSGPVIFPGENAPPTCSSSTINTNIPPMAGPTTIQISSSQFLNLCSDPDGDTLTITSPSPIPYSFSISAGQTKVISFTVSDGNNPGAAGSITYKRP